MSTRMNECEEREDLLKVNLLPSTDGNRRWHSNHATMLTVVSTRSITRERKIRAAGPRRTLFLVLRQAVFFGQHETSRRQSVPGLRTKAYD